MCSAKRTMLWFVGEAASIDGIESFMPLISYYNYKGLSLTTVLQGHPTQSVRPLLACTAGCGSWCKWNSIESGR